MWATAAYAGQEGIARRNCSQTWPLLPGEGRSGKDIRFPKGYSDVESCGSAAFDSIGF
jgi:hypothetical protein